MQQHGFISKATCWVKEASLKRLPTVWFQLHDILKKTKPLTVIENRLVVGQGLGGSDYKRVVWNKGVFLR